MVTLFTHNTTTYLVEFMYTIYREKEEETWIYLEVIRADMYVKPQRSDQSSKMHTMESLFQHFFFILSIPT